MAISVHDFEMRAKEVGIHDCRPFLTSRLFLEAGWRSKGDRLERAISTAA